MGAWKNKNYVRHTDADRVKCPYCDAMVLPRGYKAHIRLKHGQTVTSARQIERSKALQTPSNQLSLLSEPPPPPTPETIAKAPKNVQQAYGNVDAGAAILWSAAIYFLVKYIGKAVEENEIKKQTLKALQKPKRIGVLRTK